MKTALTEMIADLDSVLRTLEDEVRYAEAAYARTRARLVLVQDKAAMLNSTIEEMKLLRDTLA